MFGKIKDFMGNIAQANEMRLKAQTLDKKLKETVFEVKGDYVNFKINAKKEIVEVNVIKTGNGLAREIKDLLNRAMQKAEEISIKEMSSLLS